MRSHSTRNQLKEKSPEAKFILSNTLQALLQFKIQKIQTSVSLCVRQLHSRVHSALGTFLAAPPSCPELHTRAWSLPGVGGTLARPRWRLLRRRDLPWRLTGDKNGGSTPFRAAHRPSALRVASCVPAHARGTATVAGKHGTRSLPPTGPRRPVLSNSPQSTKLQLD